MPAGVPGPARPAPIRDASGRFIPSDGVTALAREGGRARQMVARLAQLMGLWEAPDGHEFAPYARLAREWRDDHMARLAATVGGGVVGPGPAAIVSSAALQLGASRYLGDLGAKNGDAKMLLDASRLADASRQNLIASHELCAREAAAQPQQSRTDRVIADILAAGSSN